MDNNSTHKNTYNAEKHSNLMFIHRREMLESSSSSFFFSLHKILCAFFFRFCFSFWLPLAIHCMAFIFVYRLIAMLKSHMKRRWFGHTKKKKKQRQITMITLAYSVETYTFYTLSVLLLFVAFLLLAIGRRSRRDDGLFFGKFYADATFFLHSFFGVCVLDMRKIMKPNG